MDGGKRELRRDFASRRAARDPADLARASERVAERVLALPELAAARTVAAYAALPGEVATLPLLDRLLTRGTTVLLPVLLPDADLAWGRYAGPHALRPGRLGLAEPPPDPALDVTAADVVLVPGVAFDRAGRRLGRGGGSYDRALARLRPGVPVVALALDDMLVDALPAEPHDVPVSVIVTPTQVVRALQ